MTITRPFLRAGVPAVDLIDWNYPSHELTDRLDKLSPRSLDPVGETVAELRRSYWRVADAPLPSVARTAPPE